MEKWEDNMTEMTEKERYEEENECSLIEVDDMQEFLLELAFEKGACCPYTCDDFEEVEIDGVYYFIYDKL